MPIEAVVIVAGVDACPAGWYVASWDTATGCIEGRTCPDFATVLEATEPCSLVGIDIPIGLPESGPRAADIQARRLLGRKASSVFPAPVRAALAARTQGEASAIRRAIDGSGIGAHAFNLIAKIREVDTLMTPALQDRVREMHPELCFTRLNDGVPVLVSKHAPAGLAQRHALLDARLQDFDRLIRPRPRYAGLDDILDALAVACAAASAARGDGCRVPEQPPLDARGLRMEIWF